MKRKTVLLSTGLATLAVGLLAYRYADRPTGAASRFPEPPSPAQSTQPASSGAAQGKRPSTPATAGTSEQATPSESEARSRAWLNSHAYGELESAPPEQIPWIALLHSKDTVAQDPDRAFAEILLRFQVYPGIMAWAHGEVFKVWYQQDPDAAIKYLFAQNIRLSRWQDANQVLAMELAPLGVTPELRELVEACPGDAHDDILAELTLATAKTSRATARQLILMMDDPARREKALKWFDSRK